MRPTEADNPAAPFLFFREDPALPTRMLLDPRVVVERVTQGMRGGGSADILVRWERDALADGTVNADELTQAMINQRFGPKLRCAVAVAPPAGGTLADLRFVAHGYLDAPQLQFNADGQRSFFRRRMKLRDIIWRTARRQVAQVQGRYMLSATGWDYAQANPLQDPITLAWAQLGKHVRALPCIFNPKGKPNRLARPISFQANGAWTDGPVHLFTYDDNPNAEPWTYLQALRYLVLMYLPYEFGMADLDPGQLFGPTYSGLGPVEWWRLDEDDVGLTGAYPVGWVEHMTRRCQSLAIEGMDFLEAMILLCKHAGIDFHVEHDNLSMGTEVQVRSSLSFTVPGDETVTLDVFGLERDTAQGTGGSHFAADGSLRDVSEITVANTVSNCQSAQEYGNTISRIEVVGDIEWYAVQTELIPLWKPNADWDRPTPAEPQPYRDAAYDAEEPFKSLPDGDFYKRYHAEGDDFTDGENALVGRLWGIDPAGELDPLEFNRGFGPFADYSAPWEVPQHPDQTRRRRRIREIPTVDGRQPLGVRLEVSLDAGVTWYPLLTRAKVFPEKPAIYLLAKDPLAIGSELIDTASRRLAVTPTSPPRTSTTPTSASICASARSSRWNSMNASTGWCRPPTPRSPRTSTARSPPS
jgi:hypothetical protein